MQCPYFKKVNFQKIQQLNNFQEEPQKNLHISNHRRDTYSIEDSIPEEGSTNAIKVERYRRINGYESLISTNQSQIEEGDKIITIKMPKTLQIKQFNIQNKQILPSPPVLSKEFKVTKTRQSINQNGWKDMNKKEFQGLSEISEEFSYEERENGKLNQARVFSTHKSIFFENSFYSVITLMKTKENCFCHLNGTLLKIVSIPQSLLAQISQQQKQSKTHRKSQPTSLQIKQHTSATYKHPNLKIKYFVELTRYKIQINEINSSCLQICLLSKGNKEKIEIEFVNEYERCSFECVYQSIMELIKTNIENNVIRRESTVKSTTPKSPLVSIDINSIEEEQSELSLCSLKSQRSIDSYKFTVERMKYKDSLNFLNTFDIILFKGKNIMSKIQRFITNSDFDHVGLIMRTASGVLLLLQAAGNVGVAIYTFASIQKSLNKKIYDRVAVRKYSQIAPLNPSQRTKKLLELQQFVSQVNGKKYKFDPMYLISNSIKKKKRSSANNKSIELEQQTYFCSQLVAEALKVCGIMKKNKASYKFLPKHFGDRDGLNKEMNDGHFYSDLIILEP